MADPIIEDHWRVMAIFESKSGLPRDRMINTFCFRNNSVGLDGNDMSLAFMELLRAFYFEPVAVTGQSISSYMTPRYELPTFHCYDLGQPTPREPFIRPLATAGFSTAFSAPANTALPDELAVCITWTTDVVSPKPGVVGKRGRGRTYIGSLGQSALQRVDDRTLVAEDCRKTLAAAGARMIETGQSDLPSWPSLQVLSTKYAQTDEVIGGWVDNAFDIQNRRGLDATARTRFTTELVNA